MPSVMKIGTVSQCKRRLNIDLRSVWPSVMPAVAWSDILVGGFNKAEIEECIFVSSDERALEDVLAGLYPKLTFIDISKLAIAVERVGVSIDWRTFCAKIGLRWSDEWPILFQLVRQAPQKLVTWWEMREVSARELAPIKAINDGALLQRWFRLALHVVSFEPSKSEGVQILEWLVDLLLLDPDKGRDRCADQKILAERTLASLRDRVRSERFPVASQSETLQSALAAKLPWPTGAKAAWVRHGDRTGMEIKLFSNSANELKKQIALLQNAASEWARQNE